MNVDKGNLQSLEWLVDEIEVSLKQAFEALDAYLKDAEDKPQIKVCLSCIHQVHGTLKIAECHGALLLAEEMEALVEAMLMGAIANLNDASEVLVQAILKLPAYIRQILSSGVDQPATLIALLNDLRAVQSRPLLSEGSLFSPQIDLHSVDTSVRSSLLPDNAAFIELTKKLRQMYQVALLGLIRNVDRDKNLGYLERVFSRLLELSKGTAQHPLWQVALALHEGIGQNNIQLTSAVKSLLRSLDLEIRGLQQFGVAALQGDVPVALLKNLLYYVAFSNADSVRIQAVKESFRLDDALPAGTFGSDNGLTPMLEPQAVESMASALVEEVNVAKELTSRYQQQGGLDAELLDELYIVIARIADSLAFVGQGELAAPVIELNSRLKSAIEQARQLTDAELEAIATQLVATESAVLSWGSSGGIEPAVGTEQNAELLRARDSLLLETRSGLSKVKESIVEYVSSQWDRHFLEHTPQLLTEIRGALDMMELQRPASVLRAAGDYIESHLLSGNAIPDWGTLDNLADTITSIEYYLESGSGAESAEAEAILEMAEKSVQSLDGGDEMLVSQPASAASADQTVSDPGYDIIGDADHLVSEDQPVDESTDIGLTSDVPIEADASEQNAQESDIDEEIIEVFVEEAAEVLENLNGWLPEWQANPLGDLLADVRRGFHTLKGSGRMVEASRVAELAWSIEQLLNRIMENQVTMTAATPQLVEKAVAYLPAMVSAFNEKTQEPDSALSDYLIASAESLARGEQIAEPSVSAPVEDAVSESATEDQAAEELTFEAESDVVDAKEQQVDVEPVGCESAVLASGESEDEDLIEIFIGEARAHQEQIRLFIQEAEQQAPIYITPTAYLQRALHTLKGSANMADVMPVVALVGPLERLVKELHNFQLPAEEQMLSILADSDSWLSASLELLRADQEQQLALPANLLERIEALREQTTLPLLLSSDESDGQPIADRRDLLALMTDGLQNLIDTDRFFASGQHDVELPLQAISDECTELAVASERASESSISELATALQAVYSQLLDQPGRLDEATAVLGSAHGKLLVMFDAVAADQNTPSAEAEISQLTELQQRLAEPQISELDDPEIAQEVTAEAIEAVIEGPSSEAAFEKQLDTGIDPGINVESEHKEVDQQEQSQQQDESSEVIVEQTSADQEADPEIIAIFLEEAGELLEEIDNAIQEWKASPESDQPAETLKRALHTFKGGARMAYQSELGELSHQFETWIVASEQNAKRDESFFSRLQAEQDQLHTKVKELHGQSGQLSVSQSAVSPVSTALATELAAAISPAMPLSPAVASNGADSGPQEMVKVRAALLDDLVNMAGETSISRGRIEQQISEFSFALDEMNTTIRRLQDQVRRLGIETEAQVMFRREQIEASNTLEGFDPLEMDRYSQLQQLSRSLMESASDLQDLKNTLKHKSKDAETLLVQQGRINTDLQEGLMRSRMVPFSRVVPRLRRIVRQVSGELNKQVELRLLNVEGEMDRSVLEKMLPALDHMLRNAIDHGLESAEQRVEASKPEVGSITIDLSREGGDIVIKLGDDGRGLNIEAIRKQAIRQGLMDKSAELSDQEVVQFILESGFSTSEQVSQISGRGVGLDVVNAEVRQLGGTIAIRTEQGVGSEFSIRLPFTVSINRSLMIEVGEDLYALPLSSIDGVVRMTPKELETFYRNPLSRYKYGDSEYGVRYLGSLLHDGTPPRISAEEDAVPLVLVRSEQHSFAVQVDRLIGSSEIVVKTLGAQFSAVPGLSGATVLGDGRVVVILDLLALLRTQKSLPNNNVLWLEESSAADTEAAVPVVMVVDDSVTVRKVTSRFLEREGFHILTAKDGADAMRLLRDHDPDVMLLDIEMPRMDGFEVASRLRTMSRFEALPVIMITSRTGDKHRERALSLGVNHYLGKPYREEDLLQAINELLGNDEASNNEDTSPSEFEITF